jgi:hypothetical protein
MADLNLQVFEELVRTQAQLATSKGLAGIQHDDLNRYAHELAARDQQIARLQAAVLENHEWHQQYDEHDGYAGSALEQTNIEALAQQVNL